MSEEPQVFEGTDLRGARFREADLTGARLVGCVIDDVEISAFAGRLGTVVIEGVDVTSYVLEELDRRYPERVLLREAQTPEQLRQAWATVSQAWTELCERTPSALRTAHVEGEWSLTATARHLVFAIDVWLGRMIGLQNDCFHPLGLPVTDMPEDITRDLGLDPTAEPPFEQVRAAYDERSGQVTAFLATVTEAALEQPRTAQPAPQWGPETRTVRQCLGTILREHAEHRRYVERDLRILQN